MWASCILLILSMPGAMLLDGDLPGIGGTGEGATETSRPPRHSTPPAIIVRAAAWVLNTVPRGALLLDNETDVSALVEEDKDESSAASATSPSSSSRSWRGLVLLFDRLLLVIFIIVFAALLLAYLT